MSLTTLWLPSWTGMGNVGQRWETWPDIRWSRPTPGWAMGLCIYICNEESVWHCYKNFGLGDQNSRNIWSTGLLFQKILVRAHWLQCKHFNDTSLCQSVCIVSESLKKSFSKLLKLLIHVNTLGLPFIGLLSFYILLLEGRPKISVLNPHWYFKRQTIFSSENFGLGDRHF